MILLTFASAFFSLCVVWVWYPSGATHWVQQQQRQASHQEARQPRRHEEAVVNGDRWPSSSDCLVAVDICGHLVASQLLLNLCGRKCGARAWSGRFKFTTGLVQIKTWTVVFRTCLSYSHLSFSIRLASKRLDFAELETFRPRILRPKFVWQISSVGPRVSLIAK